MTNTRITDAEVFERRYPVILRNFSLRAGSGGKGKHNGGDGVIRDIEFRIPVQVSILSERRVFRPYGLAGGEDAECGLNIWVRKIEKSDPARADRELRGSGKTDEPVEYEERRINLGGKNSAAMKPGERIIICTPGGGGWGNPDERTGKPVAENDPKHAWRGGSHANREELALQA
jgi:5-oxoprolinase (ATP-hydrolysing)